MRGALEAARAAGWEARHIRDEDDAGAELCADAVMLPWPRSFENGRLVGGGLTREQTLALLPPCRVLLAGSGVEAGDAPKAEQIAEPGRDEAFLLTNAKLTAEGAIAAAARRTGRALLLRGDGLWPHRAGADGEALRDGGVCHRLRAQRGADASGARHGCASRAA